jgi:hypothetical protein
METRIRGSGLSTVRSDAFEANRPSSTTDVAPPDEPRVEATSRRALRRPGWWEKHGHQLVLGGLVTLLISALAWLFATVIGMNREVGEMKGARSALDEKLQDLKGELGSHGQEQAKQVESLNGRIDRLDRRIDGLSGGAAQAHVRLGVVRP